MLTAGEDTADLLLRTMEAAEVADLGMTWHRCKACLDTGAGETLLSWAVHVMANMYAFSSWFNISIFGQ